MTTTSVRVLGRAHVAVCLCILARGLAERGPDLAVFFSRAHPLLEMPVEFTSGDAALAAVYLALGAQLGELARILLRH